MAVLVLLLVGMYLSYAKGSYFILAMEIGLLIFLLVKAFSPDKNTPPADTKQVDPQETHNQPPVSDSHLSSPDFSTSHSSTAKGKRENDTDFDYRDAATGMMLFGPVGAGLGIKDRDKSKDSEGEK